MGGAVPYGYRVENRRLIVVEEEAANIRLIFNLYLKHGSVRALQQELGERNIRTRPRQLSSGRTIGGIRFTNGPLAVILRNRLYLGELKHKDKYWPGEHAAIIENSVFEADQAKLDEQRRSALSERADSQAPLIGKLFNGAGERMSPAYAVKKGFRYRYYVSTSAMQSRPQESDAVHRLPADSIEQVVTMALVGQHQNMSQLERLVVHHDRLVMTLTTDLNDPDSASQTIVVPWSKPSMMRRKEILRPTDVAQSHRPMEGDERMRLLRGIAASRKWLTEIIGGSADIGTIASREGKSQRAVRMTLSLAFLDPSLIKVAIAGTLPRGYGVTRMFDLPPLFEDQWLALGLPRPRQ